MRKAILFAFAAYQARARKLSLKKIFEAIEAEEYAQAAALCKERFTARGPFWLYAARIGAELMLRVGDIDQAQAMFEEVVVAKTLPWAKLGIARAQLEDRQVLGAISSSIADTQPVFDVILERCQHLFAGDGQGGVQRLRDGGFLLRTN